MPNGVKGLWEMLKPRDPLPSLRKVENDNLSIHQFEDDNGDAKCTDDEKIKVMRA